MDYYVNWDDAWKIVWDRELEEIDENIAFEKFLVLLKKAHGRWLVCDNKLIFREEYDHMDYHFSTSVIGSEDYRWRVEQAETLRKKIDEERNVIAYLLELINDEFEKYEPLFLNIFYDRFFVGMRTEDIQRKYGISKKKYYATMEGSEWLFRNGLLIIKPNPAILKIIYGKYYEERMKHK